MRKTKGNKMIPIVMGMIMCVCLHKNVFAISDTESETITNEENEEQEISSDITDCFTDQVLREYVAENFGDGQLPILSEEVAEVTELNISGMGITNLEGISNFINLKILSCYDNEITSMDISQNKKLTDINADENQLEFFDVSGNPELERLSLGDNKIQELDVTQNPKLWWLSVGSNEISSIDVTHNPLMEYLVIQYNPISTIDVSQNPRLTNLNFMGCPISSVDISQNYYLQSLLCTDAQLEKLDLSGNPMLHYLDIMGNHLTELDLSVIQGLWWFLIDGQSGKGVVNPLVTTYQYPDGSKKQEISYEVDMNQFVKKENLARVEFENGEINPELNTITLQDGGIYDLDTGIISYTEKLDSLIYQFDTMHAPGEPGYSLMMKDIEITLEEGETHYCMVDVVEEPKTPAEPETPKTPLAPKTPENPVEPVKTTNISKTSVQNARKVTAAETGDETNEGIWMILCIWGFFSAVLLKKYEKAER